MELAPSRGFEPPCLSHWKCSWRWLGIVTTRGMQG